MSEKKYLLTESDIRRIKDLECGWCADNAIGYFDCADNAKAEQERFLESHEYREPDIPITVHDMPHCPRCKHDAYWKRGLSESGEELLRCAGCGNDYRWRKPAEEVER